jgi:hypothetical protein
VNLEDFSLFLNKFIKSHTFKILTQELALRNNVKVFQKDYFCVTAIILVAYRSNKLRYPKRNTLELPYLSG